MFYTKQLSDIIKKQKGSPGTGYEVDIKKICIFRIIDFFFFFVEIKSFLNYISCNINVIFPVKQTEVIKIILNKMNNLTFYL